MITLSTIIYEGNYRTFFSQSHWFFNFHHELIFDKQIIINNVHDHNHLSTLINEFKKLFKFNVYYVDKYITAVNDIFYTSIEKENPCFNYSIPFFVSILACKTDFILNIATDCMDDIHISNDFLKHGIRELNGGDCTSVTVSWVKDNKIMHYGQTVGVHENDVTSKIYGYKIFNTEFFDYSHIFSDQFFLAEKDKLLWLNYNINDPNLTKYYTGPSYGFGSFEMRVTVANVASQKFRGIYKNNDYYIHDKNYFN